MSAVGSRSCSYVGVFHVEGRQRYNLTFDEARNLCKHLSASLAQFGEVEKAYDQGLQTCRLDISYLSTWSPPKSLFFNVIFFSFIMYTKSMDFIVIFSNWIVLNDLCRYGWISNRQTVILRHKPHKSCAGNQTGIRVLEHKKYSDAFCYDATGLICATWLKLTFIQKCINKTYKWNNSQLQICQWKTVQLCLAFICLDLRNQMVALGHYLQVRKYNLPFTVHI